MAILVRLPDGSFANVPFQVDTDLTPTQGSKKPISSGAVFDSVEEVKAEITENTSQTDTFPEASKENVGKIYQYTGNTTENYINGYFYKCLEGNTNPVTYSWEQINVQPKSKPTLVGETLVF